MRLGAVGALRPGIDLHHPLRGEEPLVQLPPFLGIGDDVLADVFDPDARDPWRSALQVGAPSR